MPKEVGTESDRLTDAAWWSRIMATHHRGHIPGQ